MYVLGMLERLLNSADMLHLYLNAIRRLKMCRVWTITKTSSKFSICNLSMMSKLKLRWVIYLILIGHKGATELRRAKTFIPMYFFFHYCQSWSKFDTSGNKFHANPIWDLTKLKNDLGHIQAVYKVYWARFVALAQMESGE